MARLETPYMPKGQLNLLLTNNDWLHGLALAFVSRSLAGNVASRTSSEGPGTKNAIKALTKASSLFITSSKCPSRRLAERDL